MPFSDDWDENDLANESALETAEIRQSKPNWTSFRDARLISDNDAQLLVRFQREALHNQGAFIAEESVALTQAFAAVLKSVNNKEAVRYVLTTLDEVMKENREIAKRFSHLSGTAVDPIVILPDLLSRDDDIIVARASHVLVHLLSAPMPASEDVVRRLMDFVRVEVQRENRHKGFCYLAILSILQGLLREHSRRLAFFEARGMQMLLDIIKQPKNHSNTQLIYQCIHCVWLLSYSPGVKDKLVDMELIAMLVHILKGTQKEKVIRMILAVMVNLIESGDMKNLLSICGGQRLLENMRQRNWSDEDINNDMDVLLEKVGQNVEATSTFDQYCKELMSGELEWTPMHRSATFWEKNVHRFMEKDQQVLKILVAFIKPGERSGNKALSIALHDIGEFVRAHPAGKGAITKLNAKPYIMQHLTSSEPDVAKEALSCVQKLMVH